MASVTASFYNSRLAVTGMQLNSCSNLFIYLKNNNTGPKATNVLQQKKNNHKNTE